MYNTRYTRLNRIIASCSVICMLAMTAFPYGNVSFATTDGSSSEVAETEVPETEVPETEAPETEVPETEVPETEVPETEVPETEVPETEVPETEVPETEVPETEVPETEVPETEVPETEVPETEVPETEVPETEVPETEVPETEVPETEVPETEVPETEVPETEVPETEVPETEVPETEVPETEVPETEVPETEVPETEVPETEVPETEAPETEVPETEVPETEVPETEVPETEVPETSDEEFSTSKFGLREEGAEEETETDTSASNYLLSDPVVEVVSAHNANYAKYGNNIKITFKDNSFSNPSIRFFEDTSTTEVAAEKGDGIWTVTREIKETGDIDGFDYFIYDTVEIEEIVKTTKIYSGHSIIKIDNTFPGKPTLTDIVYNPSIGSNNALIKLEVSDNFDITKMLMSFNGGDYTAITDIDFCISTDGRFEYTATKVGNYSFIAVDGAGNQSLELTVIITKGLERMMEIVKYPKVVFTKGSSFTTAGGKVKVSYTFDVCECDVDNKCNFVCLCEDECTCPKIDGVCKPLEDGSSCRKYAYDCLIEDMGSLIADIDTSIITSELGEDKLVVLRHHTYTDLTATYTIDVVPKSETKFSEPSAPSELIEATVTTDLENPRYTWSSSPTEVDKEVYRATFTDNDLPVYKYISEDDSENGIKAWSAANGEYRAAVLIPGEGATLFSEATIIIDTRDENGNIIDEKGTISFDWRTNSRIGHTFNVTINDKPTSIKDVSGSSTEWNTFSQECEHENGQFVIKLSYMANYSLKVTKDIPVIIQNLTFTGEKQWKTLPESGKVTLSPVLGPNNYLFVQGEKEGVTITDISPEPYKGVVVLQDIKVHTVPSVTMYKYSETNTNAEVIKDSGKITLVYNIGTEKIDMSEGTVKVDNDGSKTFNDNYIDLSTPGIKEVKVSYGTSEFSDYFSVIVVYPTVTEANAVRASRNQPNAPKLLNGMVPVRWFEGAEESYWVVTSEKDPDWYNYYAGDATKNAWANVMLRDGMAIKEVTDLEDVKDLDMLVGKRVLKEGSSFVWIPRYTYTVNSLSEKINIKWSVGTADDNTLDSDTGTNYLTHPAFKYGDTDLTGFWMAKYEASPGESVSVQSKPNEIPYYEDSVHAITLQEAYDLSTGIKDDDYGVDFFEKGNQIAVPHLTKQAEWGAVAMLAYSKYGNVPYINNCASNDLVKTGYSGPLNNSAPYKGDPDAVIGISNYIYTNPSDLTTLKGSTTGNIYGIFDMSGGTEEYVASYIKYSNEDIATKQSATEYGAWYPGTYGENDVDIIDISIPDPVTGAAKTLYNELKNKKGWAIFDFGNIADETGALIDNVAKKAEIETWDKDEIYGRKDKRDIFLRGGDISGGSQAGILATTITRATGSGEVGFRPTILVTGEVRAFVPEIEKIKCWIDDKEGSIYASGKDTVIVHITATGKIDIEEFIFSQSDGTKMEPTRITNNGDEWIFEYDVKDKTDDEPGDSGELKYEFIYNNDEEKEGTTGIIMDTFVGANVTTNGGVITVTPLPGEQSGIKDIIVINGKGEEIKLGPAGGRVDVGEGGYTVKIEDNVGNKEEYKGSVSGEAAGTVIPKISSLFISVWADPDENGVFKFENISKLKDKRYYILDKDKVRFDVSFDQELTSGPSLVVSENRRLKFTKGDDKNWYVEFEMDSKKAYTEFIFELGGYQYNLNTGTTVTHEDYKFGIPYDGSNVNVEIGIPVITQYIDGEWKTVESVNESYPVSLEYIVTFSDITSGPYEADIDNNFDEDYGIKFNIDDLRSDIIFDPTITVGNLTVEAVEGEKDKAKIRFEDIHGVGLFSFAIRGATPENPEVINPISQDIYGHPNNQAVTSGGSNIWITPEPSVVSEYTIKYNANGGEGAPATQIKERNVDINLSTQIPTKEGYVFSHWEQMSTGDDTIIYMPGELYTKNASMVLLAIYKSDRYKVDVVIEPEVGGKVQGENTYGYGENVTLVASPNEGYRFAGWNVLSGDVNLSSMTESHTSFSMPAEDVEIEAIFEKMDYILTIESNSELGGELQKAGSYKYKDEVQLKATENEGYTFVRWEVEKGEVEISDPNSKEAVFTMPASDVTVRAIYAANLTVKTKNTKVVGTEIIGTLVTANAEVATGYRFVRWDIEGLTIAIDTTKETLIFEMPDNAVTVEAVYEEDIHNVTIVVNPNGFGQAEVTGGASHVYNELVEIKAVANEGYSFAGWSVISGEALLDSEINATTNFVMPSSDVIIEANFKVNTYTVTTTANPTEGGSVFGGGTYNFGNIVTLNAVVNKGYKFTGWVVDGADVVLSSETDAAVTFNMPSRNVNIEAKFELVTYTVEYNPNGGETAPSNQTKIHDVDLTLSSELPVWSGHVFSGWATSPTASADYQPGDTYKINSDIVLYAVWANINPYVLKTIDGEGTEVTSIHIEGTEIDVNAPETYNGLPFASWTTVGITLPQEYVTNANILITMPQNNVTLIANYDLPSTITYTISYDANEGENAPESQTKGYNQSINLRSEKPTREGYTFINWNTKVDGTGTTYLPNGVYSANAGVILYAQWDINEYTLTVNPGGTEYTGDYNTTVNVDAPVKEPWKITYNYNWEGQTNDIVDVGRVFANWTLEGKGSINSDTTNSVIYTFGAGDGILTANYMTAAVTLPTPVRPGHDFDGWYTSKVGGTKIGNGGDNYTPTTINVILYAHWIQNKYDVIYDANGGTGEPAAQKKIYGEDLTLSNVIPTRTGYTFKGWNTSAGGTGTDYGPGSLYVANVGVTLYAQWEINEYILTVNPEGIQYNGIYGTKKTIVAKEETYIITYTYNDGTTDNTKVEVTRPFTSWTLTGKGSISVNQPTTVYTFSDGDGELTANYTVNSTTLLSPVKTGYTFKGWYTSSIGGTKIGDGGETYTPSEDITLYAQWEADKYTIVYNANGGTGAPENQIKIHGEDLTLSSVIPTRPGYTFIKWDTEEDGTGLSYPAGAIYTTNAPATLYAQWDADTHIITYDANGGVGAPDAQIKLHGVDLVLSNTAPTREKYAFVGWSTDSGATVAEYVGGSTFTIDADTRLYAVWELQQFNLTIVFPTFTHIENKSGGTSVTIDALNPDTGVIAEWVAEGITLAPDQRVAPSITFTMPANDVTIYVHWVTNTCRITYDANGGTGTPDSQTATRGETVTVSDMIPTRFSHKFLGWATNSNATVGTYQPGETFVVTKDTTLYAVWEYKDYKVTVEFPTFTEVAYKSSGVEVTVKAIRPSTTVVPQWTAEGITLTPAQLNALEITFTMPENDVTLELEWVQTEFTITYNANGGSGAPASQTKTRGEDLTLSSTAPTRTDYIFLGWAIDSNATEATYQAGGTFTTEADTTLYAVWEERATTVLFNWSTTGQLEKRITVKTNKATYIDWDDGTISSIPASNGEEIILDHTYTSESSYDVKIFNNAVTQLKVSYTNINSVDVTRNTELEWLDVSGNNISSINLANNTNLERFEAIQTPLTGLNIDNCPELVYLDTGNSLNIGTLNLSNNTKLETLSCWSNGLTSLNVSNNVKLTSINCGFNSITSLDVTNNKDLVSLNFNENQVTSIDLSQNTKLERLDAVYNRLTGLNVDNCPELKHLDCGNNSTIGSLNVSNNTKLEELSCWDNGLTSLNVDNNPELILLYVWSNQVGNVNFSNNTKLIYLNCGDTGATALDLSANTQLKELNCAANALTELDISNNTQLTDVYCDRNSLTLLDISNNTLLNKMCCTQSTMESLYVNETQQTNLNIVSEASACGAAIETDKTVHKYTNTEVKVPYTVTYNANGGSFDNGTINKVNYWTGTITETKTAKTSNVNSAGTSYSGDYGDNQSITKTINIPGATSLTVKITYQTESTSYDWVCVYNGSATPSASNYSSSISGKLGGTTKTTKTYTVSGDTVKFYFKSDSSNCSYFGYYAVVTGSYEKTEKTSGEYKIPTNSGYVLKGWSEDSSSTTVEYLADGSPIPNTSKVLYAVWGEIPWNDPQLVNGLTPVNWNGSDWIETDEANWDYNYDTASIWSNSVGSSTYGVGGDGTAKWANAKTADGSLYVWIPRFTYYTYASSNKASWNADVQGTSKTYILFSDGTTDYITDSSEATAYTYNKHSAFTLTDKAGNKTELTGFWVAKYEASKGTGNIPESKPQATAWVNETVGNMFTYAKDLNGTNTEIGAHLVKDSEWGAVAYLTSAVGRIPYINNHETLTGYAGESQDANTSATNYLWNTENGVKGSTTHNIYGVYDMSGGRYEYTAAYYTGGTTSEHESMKSSYSTHGQKYVDLYESTTLPADAAQLNWDSDYATGLIASNPIPARSGEYSSAASAGIFGLSYDYGHAFNAAGFRVALFGGYTVNYDANNGTGAPSSQYATIGEPLVLSSVVPTREGYKFKGWSTDSSAVVATYQPGDSFTSTVNTTLYAVWEASYRLTIEFPAFNKVEDKVEGVEVTVGVQPIADQVFKGWTATGIVLTEEQKVSTEITFTMPANSVTLVANYGPEGYRITYDANNGTGAPEAQTKPEGETLVLSSIIPARTGYKFKGWSTSSSATTATYQPGDNFTTDEDTTLYAVWQQVPTYTVTYNANNGTGAPSAQIKTQEVDLVLSSTEPTRTGYSFKGWATSSGATVAAYQPGDTFTTDSNTTLYAVWEVETYTVSYDANGGSGAPSAQTKEYGVPLTLSSTEPTRTGYDFKGWSTDSGAASVTHTAGGNFTINEDTTLYAVWEAEKYTISYNANGGSGAPSAQTKTYGVDLTLSSTEPTKTDYRFLGWDTSSSATAVRYYAGGTFTEEADTVLYAVWGEAALEEYTISYDANGGSGAPSSQTKTQGISLTLRTGEPTRTGHDFLGWATSSSATSATYQPGGTFTTDENTTLYAVWDPEEYTVSYDANGGSGAPSSQTKTYGVSLTLSSTEPTRSGYDFLGWSTSSSASSATYDPGDSFTTNETTTLYAVWSAKTYTISYNANGGSGAPSSQTKTHGVALTLRTGEPTRTGYDFLGWSTSSSASSATYDPGDSFTTNATTTLYAVWEAEEYTISYNANGGSGAPSSQTKTYGVSLTLSSTEPTRSGYNFLGWSTSSSASSATYDPGDSFTTNATTTLYAVWSAKTYTVSYVAIDGTGAPSSQTKTHGVALTLSTQEPTRSGYKFTGWYVNGSSDRYDPGAQYTNDASVTLYAEWKALYTISYDANGGSGAPSDQTKVYGETLTLSSTKPTRSGYIFKGWATSSSATSATYQPGGSFTTNAATTLYAVWEACTHTGATVANNGKCTTCGATYVTGISLSYSYLTYKSTDSDGSCVIYKGKDLATGSTPGAPTISASSTIDFGTVSYSSSNSSVASVSSSGVVTVKSAGIATITATSGSYSASYKIFAANALTPSSSEAAVRASASSSGEYMGYLDDASYVILSGTTSGWQRIEAYHNGGHETGVSSLVGGYVDYSTSSFTRYTF